MIRIPTTRLAVRAAERILKVSQKMQTLQTEQLGQVIDQAANTPMDTPPAPDGLEQVILAKALDL